MEAAEEAGENEMGGGEEEVRRGEERIRAVDGEIEDGEEGAGEVSFVSLPSLLLRTRLFVPRR